MKKLFEIKDLRCSYDKKYVEGTSKVVLEINHLVIPRGKKIFIVGESGIGKSTILETLGLIISESTAFFSSSQGNGAGSPSISAVKK